MSVEPQDPPEPRDLRVWKALAVRLVIPGLLDLLVAVVSPALLVLLVLREIRGAMESLDLWVLLDLRAHRDPMACPECQG